MSERKTTEELAALLAGCVVAGLPVPRESSTLEARAAFLRWQHAASKADYCGLNGFGVFPFDLPEVGSHREFNGWRYTVISSRWGREAQNDKVEYNLILFRGQSTKEQNMATMYGAGVIFTDPEIAEVFTEQDSPDKARITALQKAKLTGHEPKLAYWTTDDGDQVMLWPSEERMSVATYNERFPDDVRFRDPETL